MGDLQDKNHFIALTAEALLAPPVVNKVYVRLVSPALSLPPPLTPPLARVAPICMQAAFPTEHSSQKKKRETKSYFYGKLRSD